MSRGSSAGSSAIFSGSISRVGITPAACSICDSVVAEQLPLNIAIGARTARFRSLSLGHARGRSARERPAQGRAASDQPQPGARFGDDVEMAIEQRIDDGHRMAGGGELRKPAATARGPASTVASSTSPTREGSAGRALAPDSRRSSASAGDGASTTRRGAGCRRRDARHRPFASGRIGRTGDREIPWSRGDSSSITGPMLPSSVESKVEQYLK